MHDRTKDRVPDKKRRGRTEKEGNVFKRTRNNFLRERCGFAGEEKRKPR